MTCAFYKQITLSCDDSQGILTLVTVSTYVQEVAHRKQLPNDWSHIIRRNLTRFDNRIEHQLVTIQQIIHQIRAILGIHIGKSNIIQSNDYSKHIIFLNVFSNEIQFFFLITGFQTNNLQRTKLLKEAVLPTYIMWKF